MQEEASFSTFNYIYKDGECSTSATEVKSQGAYMEMKTVKRVPEIPPFVLLVESYDDERQEVPDIYPAFPPEKNRLFVSPYEAPSASAGSKNFRGHTYTGGLMRNLPMPKDTDAEIAQNRYHQIVEEKAARDEALREEYERFCRNPAVQVDQALNAHNHVREVIIRPVPQKRLCLKPKTFRRIFVFCLLMAVVLTVSISFFIFHQNRLTKKSLATRV
ncbi:uncharacterized protein NEMAJ01_1003 [Nematocida major]|uniref:uncharacterized protein n=1 Tax=Nematocida major TaxID=1912982 RepID=UPI002007E5C8|nr:uncharacterized protein NEMAJ01_1003 [Nematocida major]KAH9386107.1 hypothetical protein NEMAJ01_1003 [Nematocida major]